ncbi:MAG: hypothetical protein NTU44_15380 [Bacteroidetes bacterium]|nr:hypothetical protein [Bacteroidota bacterium]
MASGGVTARNTRQGFRSEYIVKYIFSAFGTAVDVSAENDLGIDLLCNLTSFDGLLITYKSTYGIQVKSKGATFKYSGKQATKWLSKLEFPLLLVEVDKHNSRIKVYSTWNLNKYLLGLYTDDEDKYPEEIEFIQSNSGKLDPPDCADGKIPVGVPILDFHYSDVDNDEKRKIFHAVISKWLEVDNENYRLRRAGVARTFGYNTWVTNEPITDGRDEWDLRYYYSPFHSSVFKKLLAHVITAQGVYCLENTGTEKREPFKTEFNDFRYLATKYLQEYMGDFEKNVFKSEI